MQFHPSGGAGRLPEGHNVPSVPMMPESPERTRNSSSRPLMATPQRGGVRDWEGFMESQRPNSRAATTPRNMPQHNARHEASFVHEYSNPADISVSSINKVLNPARAPPTPGGANIPHSPYNPQAAAGAGGGPYNNHGYSAGTPTISSPAVSKQAYSRIKREEYERRMDAEARGEVYRENRPYSTEFLNSLPYGPGGNSLANVSAGGNGMISVDFEGRSRNIVAPQVVGTKEEIAWLHPPPIPLPVGWNGYWDLCAGHELILQLMAVSGANPDNSPSLTENFMYPELLSAFQRLQYGTYLIHYQRGEPPHERYFYTKSLPLANKAQYCPFLCWSTHRHAHQAKDCIPLANVMWVTSGTESPLFRKYLLGGDYIKGPRVGKREAEILTHGCFTVWYYDSKGTRTIDICATDPLVYLLWMKLLEDVSAMNAALDVTGAVRSLQKDIESSRENGTLGERFEDTQKKKKSFFS